MVSFKAALLLSGAALMAQAQTIPADLVGTWSSKSNSTMTGSGFYDPVNDRFTEPQHTGISYSFTLDGYFEEAYYRAVANPTNPKCPQGIIQWQHGKFTKNADGSLDLDPIKSDGRQLFSDPCEYNNAVYTRYNASETFKRYEVVIDKYHKIKRLNLFKKDGAPLMPLYIAYETPNMLPTTTLNPLVTATAAASKQKRGDIPSSHEVLFRRSTNSADQWWWFGVFLTAGGGIMYYFF